MSCSRTQHGSGRSRTPDLSLRSPTLYHWATALPGLRRYKRLNYGISASPEIFQNEVRQALEGLEGCLNISDDIIIYGANQDNHDKNLQAVFERLKQKNLTLNRSKCVFSQKQVKLELRIYIFWTRDIGWSGKGWCYQESRTAQLTVWSSFISWNGRICISLYPWLQHYYRAVEEINQSGRTMDLVGTARKCVPNTEKHTE